MAEAFFLLVKMASDDIYEIFDWRTVAIRPTFRSCTFREWNVTRIPCKRICAVIHFMQQSIVNFVYYRMMVDAFNLSYAPTLDPAADYDKSKV